MRQKYTIKDSVPQQKDSHPNRHPAGDSMGSYLFNLRKQIRK